MNEKVKIALKKAFMECIIDEYKKSDESSFTEFLCKALSYHGLYLPLHLNDADLLEKVSLYNDITFMDEALE